MLLSTLLLPAVAGVALAESFNLYAYGDGIGGLPLHYADGNAIISQNPPVNATDTSVVAFTTDPSTSNLIGNPNATSGSTGTAPPFSNELLYIPGPSSTSNAIGFTTDTEADAEKVTDRFSGYGNFLLVETDDGQLTARFSVRKSEGADSGEYSLLWNVTAESADDVIAVSMRSVAPSSEEE